METESVNKKVKESLELFEALPEIQPSGSWNEALNRRLLSSPRERKVRPILAIPIALLVLINAGFLIKALLPGDTFTSRHSQKLEVIAENILINPDSANN